ncbi:hypothetical protein QVD17_19996 [Tagetes erecta]|uniref:Uncharacterized protein n=1 Tax=Tagetes erecta TaxID=13708 RepID=A0AAD8KQS7_TARER|nr:hypothetical protein QVD17_19996 [Tagetes erecta]
MQPLTLTIIINNNKLQHRRIRYVPVVTPVSMTVTHQTNVDPISVAAPAVTNREKHGDASGGVDCRGDEDGIGCGSDGGGYGDEEDDDLNI